mmetsp:Transcript_8512/g.20921  ORF Transcript_8512/g.20921 Transcript_8512/m.20921 type:complete len:228 (-) Transcript_8512:1590-2273(-)
MLDDGASRIIRAWKTVNLAIFVGMKDTTRRSKFMKGAVRDDAALRERNHARHVVKDQLFGPKEASCPEVQTSVFLVVFFVCHLGILFVEDGGSFFCRELGVSADVAAAVELGQVQEIGPVGLAVLFWVLRVVHAVAQVLVVEILVPVGQAKSMSQLVTAGVEFLGIAFKVEIEFVELGDRGNNSSPARAQQYLVDSTPTLVAVIAVADLEFSHGGRALVFVVDPALV